MPQPGKIGIFDRSHYEDVLIARVRELAPAEEIERRYDAINEFEQAYVEGGGTIIKCLLHITADDQKERLTARLDDPTKHWKYNPADVDERALWDDYQQAYDLVLERCYHRARSLVRRSERTQVVPQLGRGDPAARAPALARAHLADRRLRPRRREGPGRRILSYATIGSSGTRSTAPTA